MSNRRRSGKQRSGAHSEQYERAMARKAVASKNRKWGSSGTYAVAGRMRENPTPAEAVLWEWLRGNLTGIHFRRKAVISDRIVDFYCGLVRIAVEVDEEFHHPGEYHERDEDLKRFGVETIRVPARLVREDTGGAFEGVRGRILAILTRDESLWRREKYLEYYGDRLYWRETNKNLAVLDLYGKLSVLGEG